MRVRLALFACAAALAAAPATRADEPAVPVPDPPATATDPGQILIDEGAVKIGLVTLSLPHGCRRAPFQASVRGNGITRVDFRVDGRLVRSVRAPDSTGRYAVRIDPRRVRRGAHALGGDIFFGRTQSAPDKRVRGTFRSCARR